MAMQFYKVIIFCFASVYSISLSAQEKKSVDFVNEKKINTEVLEKGLQNVEEFQTKEMESWVTTINKPPTNEEQKQAIKIIQSTPDELISKATKNDDSNSTNPVFAEIENSSSVITPKLQKGNQSKRYGDIDGYILVSLSMPKTSLERLFLESVYQYPNKNLVFLFQGWNAPHLKEFMSELFQNFESIETAPSVAIDPTVFKALDVEDVPYFALKTKEGQWKGILGDVTITQAIDESENQYSNAAPVGRTYPIKEQNMLSYIEQKIKAYDFDKDIKTTSGNFMKDRFDVDLIVSKETRTYYVDPTTVIKKAIMHKGKVIVAPGTKVNPLQYMALTKDYVFIDATDKAQVEIAKKWRKKNKRMTLITTKMPKAESTLKMLVANFDQLYEVDPLLKRRFGITHIPSKVSQKGMVLEVTVDMVDQSEIYEEER
jgi:conjugal transfer pilus assembly protein TraW